MDTNNIAAIIVRSTDNKFFAHRRNAHKKTFPSLYGLGAGGHIRQNESPALAAKRELLEETGIEAEPIFLFSFPFSDYQVHVFETISDGPVADDGKEWQSSGWFTLREIQALSHSAQLMPDTKLYFERYLRDYAKSF